MNRISISKKAFIDLVAWADRNAHKDFYPVAGCEPERYRLGCDVDDLILMCEGEWVSKDDLVDLQNEIQATAEKWQNEV